MSKESDLAAQKALVRNFVDGETPTVTEWNVNPEVLRDVIDIVGPGFTNSDTNITAITTKYNANHESNGSHAPPSEWVSEAATATFMGPATFSLPGDRTSDAKPYRVGDRLRVHQGSGGTTQIIVAIDSVQYAGGITTFIVRAATTTSPLTNPIAALDRAVARESQPRIGSFDLLDGVLDDARLFVDAVIPGYKLSDNAVDRRVLVDGEVVNSKLGVASVTAEKMATNSVGASALQANSVTETAIANASISGQKIQNATIDSQKLTANSVLEAYIVSNAISAGKLQANSVTTVKILDANVTTPKLANEAVTPAKLLATRWQTPSAASAAMAGVYQQGGWHYAIRSATASVIGKAIVFPVAFPTAVLHVSLTCVGFRAQANGAPTSIEALEPFIIIPGGSTESYTAVVMGILGGSLSRSGFTAVLAANNSNSAWNNGDYAVFTWVAVGY